MPVKLVSNICQTDSVTNRALTVVAESRILTDGLTHKLSANMSLTCSLGTFIAPGRMVGPFDLDQNLAFGSGKGPQGSALFEARPGPRGNESTVSQPGNREHFFVRTLNIVCP